MKKLFLLLITTLILAGCRNWTAPKPDPEWNGKTYLVRPLPAGCRELPSWDPGYVVFECDHNPAR